MTADLNAELDRIKVQAERVHHFGGEEQEVADDALDLVAVVRAVLAVEFDTRVNSWSQDQDWGYAQGMARAQEMVREAITTAWEAQR